MCEGTSDVLMLLEGFNALQACVCVCVCVCVCLCMYYVY